MDEMQDVFGPAVNFGVGRPLSQVCLCEFSSAIESNGVCGIGMRNDLLDFSGENHFGSELDCLPERALTEVIS
jgi:hypothetical protein